MTRDNRRIIAVICIGAAALLLILGVALHQDVLLWLAMCCCAVSVLVSLGERRAS